MKQVPIVILASVLASAGAPDDGAKRADVTMSTSKSVADFGGCFVNAQDRAALAWSYVPKADGGTFSNVGARGARNLYFLAIADRGASREIRLDPANAGSSIDPRILRAVHRCA